MNAMSKFDRIALSLMCCAAFYALWLAAPRQTFGANGQVRYVQRDKETGESRQETVKLLENFGIDIVAVAQSGRPYTKAFSNTQSTIVGGYNGARLPWGFYLDLIVDKRFPIKVGKRETNLIVSLSVTNLFDIRNITSVWPVTGNPDDNGYLTDPETQAVIERYLDPASFRDLYTISLSNNYWRYSTPRRFLATVAYSF